MAILNVVTGKTEVQLMARARANRIPPELSEVPGGLYPLYSAAFEVDEYRIMSGWPVPVPEGDIRVEFMLTGDGTVLSNRVEPTAVITGAVLRWVADPNFYDEVAGRWTPLQGNGSPWEAAPATAPTLISDYEYRVKDERFTDRYALNFDSDTEDHLSNDLGLTLGGTSGYTVVMVLNPNSIYGNDETKLDNVLWGPQSTEGHWVSFAVADQTLTMTTEARPTQNGVAIGDQLRATAPTFLAMVVNRPQTTLYAAVGPGNLKVVSLVAGEAPEPLSTRFWLGKGPFSTSLTMDMALFDLGLYPNPLTSAEVADEFAILSQVYGGDS